MKRQNLSARLRGIAEPNTVAIAEGTRRLLGDLFELQDLAPKYLKGIAASARAWAVLRGGQSRAASRPARDRPDSPRRELDKLDAVLAQTATSKQDAALFAEMLLLSNDGHYPPRPRSPPTPSEDVEALTSQMQVLARQKPLLMIFEDLHWIDPTSFKARGRMVDGLRTLSVLLIVTYRPEFEQPCMGWPYVTALMLNRLGERETLHRPLSPSVRQDIIERTDGIPLFVEELTMGSTLQWAALSHCCA